MLIRDHLRWQDSTDLDAFITRLNDDEGKVRDNIRQYVVGEQVHQRLDHMLGSVGKRLADNRDVGRYIHGAFGSGKSNLMAVLGKMLEGDEAVYDLGHPRLRQLRQAHPWLDQQRILVVRINMMGQHSLVRALYDGYARALPPGVLPPSFTDEERVFELIEKDAQRVGGLAALLEQAAADQAFQDIPEMPQGMPPELFAEFFERMRHGDPDKRLALAAALYNWRNHGERPLRPDDLWIDARGGLDRLARHAQEQGYQAVAWLVDELIIWIRGKERSEYITQLNNLSAMVDHDAARVIPFYVAVAIQMDVARTCPQDLSQRDFHDQVGHIRDRFQPQLELEDQDLYEVAAERVLARRDDLAPNVRAAFEAAIDNAFVKHDKAITAMSGGVARDLVRRLYPFNPALLRILVDVTQALSRNRTAIAALYRLLARHADLKVGSFIPVGAVWDFVFEPENVSYVKQNTSSVLCQRLADTHDTYTRMDGKLEKVARECGAEPHELRQLVRTALLCQLSDRPYFPDGRPLGERITASMLLHLNQTDVKAMTPRSGISKVADLFRRLSGSAPHVQVTGKDSDPVIHVKIEQLDIERVLTAARGEVGQAERFAYMRKLLVDQLGLNLGTGNAGPVDILWRGTRRRGRVKLVNVRTVPYAGRDNGFDPGKDEFLVLVDYPFDEESGRNRQDDLDNARRARARSTHWTVTWLPEHLAPSELESLDNAAAVEQIRKDPRRFFEYHSPREADSAARALEAYQASRRTELEGAVRRLYFDEGLVQGLKASLDGIGAQGLDRSRAVDVLGGTVLDKRYPNHPRFRRRVGPGELAQVAEWVIFIAKTGQTKDLKSAEMTLVDAIVEPLQLAHKGPSGITRRTDGFYLTPILEWVGNRRRIEAAELRSLLMDEPDQVTDPELRKLAFGFTKDVADFFLFYLLQVEGFEAHVSGRSATVHGMRDVSDRFVMVKEDVVDHPEWDKALRVAESLLGITGRADLPTPPEQDKLCREVANVGRNLEGPLKVFESRLREVCTWAWISPDECPRLQTAVDLVAYLDGVMADTGKASRTRRLVSLFGDPRMARFEQMRATLADESAALSRLQTQRIAFEQIEKKGSQEDRDAVVQRLRNLLQDPPETVQLADKATAWVSETERRFAALLEGDKGDDKKKEQERKAREAAQRKAKEEAERKAAEDRKARDEAERKAAADRKAKEEAERKSAADRKALEEAQAKLEAARLAAEQAKQHDQRAGRRELHLEAVPRAKAASRAQQSLATLLEESKAVNVTIHIVVEDAE